MFVTNKLVFLEIQKTGGTHIRRLLKCYTDGKPIDKHNRLTDEYADRFVFGSIRNPWDWYVSLWAYGVSGRGAIRSRCVSGIDFNYYHRMLPKTMGKNWLTPKELLISLYYDGIKPVSTWQHVYDNATEPELFRHWLRLLLSYQRRFDIGEGYGFSPLSIRSGLLTYRYFCLLTRGDHVFSDMRLASSDGISEFDRQFNISRGIIKTESLEEDFIRVLEEAGHTLSEMQRAEIRDKNVCKTNVSVREPAAYYYDDETSALVSERERYLIDKYDYKAPILNN